MKDQIKLNIECLKTWNAPTEKWSLHTRQYIAKMIDSTENEIKKLETYVNQPTGHKNIKDTWNPRIAEYKAKLKNLKIKFNL